jgi:hypothetical protein
MILWVMGICVAGESLQTHVTDVGAYGHGFHDTFFKCSLFPIPLAHQLSFNSLTLFSNL